MDDAGSQSLSLFSLTVGHESSLTDACCCSLNRVESLRRSESDVVYR